MEKKGVRKGAWTKDEDTLLKICVEKYGEGHWHKVPLRAGLKRCRKSCRLRWLNYLRPDIKRGYFTKDEVDLTVRLHKLLGNRWSLIAGRLPGRTANDVKNFWNTNIARKKKLLQSSSATQNSISRVHNVIKPRPRTFSNLNLPVLSNQQNKTKEGNLNPQNETSLREEPDCLMKSHVEGSRSNQPFPLSEEEVDECIQWWGNLLEVTENGDGGLQGMCGPANNRAIEEGWSSLSVDGDVWGLDNFSLPD